MPKNYPKHSCASLTTTNKTSMAKSGSSSRQSGRSISFSTTPEYGDSLGSSMSKQDESDDIVPPSAGKSKLKTVFHIDVGRQPRARDDALQIFNLTNEIKALEGTVSQLEDTNRHLKKTHEEELKNMNLDNEALREILHSVCKMSRRAEDYVTHLQEQTLQKIKSHLAGLEKDICEALNYGMTHYVDGWKLVQEQLESRGFGEGKELPVVNLSFSDEHVMRNVHRILVEKPNGKVFWYLTELNLLTGMLRHHSYSYVMHILTKEPQKRFTELRWGKGFSKPKGRILIRSKDGVNGSYVLNETH